MGIRALEKKTGGQVGVSTVRGELCSETMQWLDRSLVEDLLKPTSRKDLFEKVSSEWVGVESLRVISSFGEMCPFGQARVLIETCYR